MDASRAHGVQILTTVVSLCAGDTVVPFGANARDGFPKSFVINAGLCD